MEQIKQFENMSVQNVGSFNKIFRSTPILNVDEKTPVQIGEVLPGDERAIYVGSERVSMCLTQRKTYTKLKKKYSLVVFKEKQCNKCGELKEFSQFYKHAASKGGVRADCKKCCIKTITNWKKRNKKSQ